MRVALATEGSRGDVYPMLALGESLRALGHEVRLCAPPDFADAVRARGLGFHPVGEPVRPYLESVSGAIVEGGLTLLRETQEYSRASLPRQVRDLEAAFDGIELAVGAGVQLGAPSVCERMEIPYRYVVYCPSLVPSPAHAPPVFERQTMPPWLNRIAWWISRALAGRTLGRMVAEERRALGLPPVEDLFQHMLTRQPIVAVDHELAPAPRTPEFAVRQVPCLHPFEPGRLPEKLEQFLAAGPAPVYLGFGSMTDPDPGDTTRCLLDAIRAAGQRAVISRGWAQLGDAPLPEDVFVTGPVSHAALFPRVSVVVHHGGAGTTTTAARAGVPQVIVPHLLDQFYWAHRVGLLGLGPPPIRRRRLEPSALAEAIASTADNEFVRERASQLGVRLRRRAGGPGAAEAVLEDPASA